MRKRLLMIAAFALSMVGSAFAQDKQSQPWTPMTQTPALEGYVYTATQRVKIMGENIVTNGAFESKDGWTNAVGEDLNAEVWAIEAGAGPGGENVIKSLAGSTADAALCGAWALSSGTYVVMYDIKGAAPTVTGIINNNTSCLDFFLTKEDPLTKGAEGDVQVATVNGFKEEWKTVAYYFEAADGQKLVMHAEKLNADAMITNIRILPAKLVYDDRVLKEKLAYVDKLIATGKFILDTENGFIDNVVGTMREMLNGSEEGALDDISGAQGLINAYEIELAAWYDLNASDLLKDEKKWSAYGDTRKMNNFGGNWKGTGGRWFHKNNGGSNEITNDGDEIGHRFQGGTEGNASQYYTITPSFAGTYMFSLDIVGHYMTSSSGKSTTYYAGTTDNYITDWNRDFKGVTMYAGKDIMGADAEANATMNAEQEGQKIDCGIISNPNAKNNPQKFVVFYEVSQEMVDAQTPVTFGITYILDPDRGFTTKLGSNVNIANPQIRLIGVTQDIIDFQNEVKKIIVQQGPFKERLDLANEDMAKTAAAGYPWGKAKLKESIDYYQPLYDASLTVVDAEGNVLNEDFIKGQMEAAAAGTDILYSDSLLHCVQAMNSARSAFSRINALPAVTYPQKVADAESVYADEFYGAGDKVTFRAAIDNAVTKRAEILAASTDETRVADSTEFENQLKILAEAVEAFKVSANNVPFIDIDFANGFAMNEEAKWDTEGKWATTEDGYNYIKGAKGEMIIGNANPDDNTGAPNEKGVGTMDFALGFGEELTDVLRVGNGSATVNIPENSFDDNDCVRIDFNAWLVQLSNGEFKVELKNASDQTIAGFGYIAYNGDNGTTTNSFNNEANEGMDLNKYATSNRDGDVASHVDGNKNSFSLVIDNKAKGVKGTLTTTKGTTSGKLLPINTQIDETTTLSDMKIAKFVLTSNYTNYVGRRCWFDDLKVYKYPSQAEGPITAIQNVETVKANDGAVYNLAGQKVSKSFKGIVIKNGKKYFVK